MPRINGPTLKEYFAAHRRSTEKGWRAAAEYLVQCLRQLVGVQTGPNGPGSPPGSPPFRRTGTGQDGITYQMEAKGFSVGVTRDAWYMAAHEEGINYPNGYQRRPWLSHWRRYAPGMLTILRRHARRKF